MVGSILIVAVIFILANLPDLFARWLTKRLAFQSSQIQNTPQKTLQYLEWIRLYPLKKAIIALLWLFCLYASVRGIYLSYLTRRTDFFWITAFFIALTILTVRKVVRYLRTPYHCIPLLNRRLSKQHLQELLENEVFELVKFQDRLLKKYVTVLLSQHWAVIDGTLISKNLTYNGYFAHDDFGMKNTNIKITYLNGESFRLRSSSLYCDGLGAVEMMKVMQNIIGKEMKDYTEDGIQEQFSTLFSNQSEEEKLWYLLTHDTMEIKQAYDKRVKKPEDMSKNQKRDKSIIYWNMNYRGKFKRTLWFIPIVIVLCFLTPYFMGGFWLFYDVILIVILIGQLVYTYQKMKLEESEKTQHKQENKDKR